MIVPIRQSLDLAGDVLGHCIRGHHQSRAAIAGPRRGPPGSAPRSSTVAARGRCYMAAFSSDTISARPPDRARPAPLHDFAIIVQREGQSEETRKSMSANTEQKQLTTLQLFPEPQIV